MGRRPTLRDVSTAANVSIYAASQALAGKPGVAARTRVRIQAAADELGYVPNRLASNLKDSSSSTVGVLTAGGRNQYYAMLVQAVDRALRTGGFHAIVNDSMREQFDTSREREAVEDLLQQRVSAVICTYSLSPASMALLQRWEIPVLFVDSPPPAGYEDMPFVGTDNLFAGHLVAEHLFELGHKDCLLVAYPEDWGTRGPREKGFTDAAAAFGMNVEILDVANSSESSAKAVEAYLRDASLIPTAIYALNTVLLQGTLLALRALRLNVPADMSVVGFDEFEWSELVNPPITLVDQHIEQIGRDAGRHIISLIKGLDADAGGLHFPDVIRPELRVRDSTSRRGLVIPETSVTIDLPAGG